MKANVATSDQSRRLIICEWTTNLCYPVRRYRSSPPARRQSQHHSRAKRRLPQTARPSHSNQPDRQQAGHGPCPPAHKPPPQTTHPGQGRPPADRPHSTAAGWRHRDAHSATGVDVEDRCPDGLRDFKITGFAKPHVDPSALCSSERFFCRFRCLGPQAEVAGVSGLCAWAAANASRWRRDSRVVAYLMAIMRAVVMAAPSSSVQATARPSGTCWSSGAAGGSAPVTRRQPIRTAFWAASTAIIPAACSSAWTERLAPFSAIGVPRAAAMTTAIRGAFARNHLTAHR